MRISRLPPSPSTGQVYFLDLELNKSAFINLSSSLETWFDAAQECVLFGMLALGGSVVDCLPSMEEAPGSIPQCPHFQIPVTQLPTNKTDPSPGAYCLLDRVTFLSTYSTA